MCDKNEDQNLRKGNAGSLPLQSRKREEEKKRKPEAWKIHINILYGHYL